MRAIVAAGLIIALFRIIGFMVFSAVEHCDSLPQIVIVPLTAVGSLVILFWGTILILVTCDPMRRKTAGSPSG